jgi:5'(3')-deoxyribonucleotidase
MTAATLEPPAHHPEIVVLEDEPEYALSHIAPVITQPLALAVDIDDVLHPWYRLAHEACVAENVGNARKVGLPDTWHMWDAYGVEEDEWAKVINSAAVFGNLYTAPPMTNVVWWLNALKEAGHEIHLVTARGLHAGESPVSDLRDIIRKKTINWVFENDIPHDSLTFLKNKTRFLADVYIDDGAHNVAALSAAGRVVYLCDAPHNQSFDYFPRVPSFAAFAKMIVEAS